MSIRDLLVDQTVIPVVTIADARAYVAGRDPEAREFVCAGARQCLLAQVVLARTPEAGMVRIISNIALYKTEASGSPYAYRPLTSHEEYLVATFDDMRRGRAPGVYVPTNAQVLAMLDSLPLASV